MISSFLCNRQIFYKKIFFAFFALQIHSALAQIPKPDHIVIIMFQNKDYAQIVGSSNAPYINSFLSDTNTALFTQSYALTHPSQPNYLMLYSGSNQGVTNDIIPTNTPFTNCNLGASLINKGYSFTGYSEDMPSVGYLGDQTSLYFRKHNPWSDWQGTGANNIPPGSNQPFSAFPSDYNNLPNVCFIIPNINNCMHNGTIAQGDSWFYANLNTYRLWALNHNSLLILTFDEDSGSDGNRILTFFYGPMIKGGTYNTRINHYDVLRTLEDIYSLAFCGGSASGNSINYIWKSHFAGIDEMSDRNISFDLFPNPAKDKVSLSVTTKQQTEGATILVKDICGRTCIKKVMELEDGNNRIDLDCPFSSGLYFLNLSTDHSNINCKFVIE
jgi:hypothetical protein